MVPSPTKHVERRGCGFPIHMFGGTGNHVFGSLAFAHMQHTSFSVNVWPPPPIPGCLPPPPMGLPPPPIGPPMGSPRLNAAFWQPGDAAKPCARHFLTFFLGLLACWQHPGLEQQGGASASESSVSTSVPFAATSASESSAPTSVSFTANFSST